MTYTFSNLGYAVKLSQEKWLEGEDAKNFLNEVDDLNTLWENSNSTYKAFSSYEKHLEALIECYF